MKACPQCGTVYEDDYVFCMTDGNALNEGDGEQETYVNRRITMAPVVPATETAAYCASCGLENRAHSKFCKKCGGLFDVANNLMSPQAAPQFGFSDLNVNVYSSDGSSRPQFGETVTFQPPNFVSPTSAALNPGLNKSMIIGVGVVGGALLSLIIFTLLGSSVSSPTSSTANSSSNNTNNSKSESETTLPRTFVDRQYEGTIAGTTSLAMSLTRNGTELSGYATTLKTDTLSGKIEDNGEFKCDAYENGEVKTGIFSGRIYNDGTLSGTWTTPDGRKGRSFSLRRQ